jgi:hypothetical protein
MSLLSAILSWFRRRPARPQPVPPAPTERAIAVVVPGIAGASVMLGEFMGDTNADGYICFNHVPVSQTRIRLSIGAPGYEHYVLLVELPADARNYNLMVTGAAPAGPHQIALPALVPTIVALPALVTTGAVFGLATGERWTAIECTDFQLFQRFLRGEDLSTVLQQRRDLGFNLLRVFGMCAQMFRLFPQEYGDRYWSGLVDFCALVARAGLYVEFVVFADATLVMPEKEDQLRHWARCCEILRVSLITNLIVELGNELSQPVNRLVSISELVQPPDLIVSHGSNGSQAEPVRPAWSYETFHTNDAPEWTRKVGHNAMEWANGGAGFSGSGRPVLANENTRCPDRFQSPQQAFDAAAGAALLCAGSCFHSVHGKSSELFDEVELACARAWVEGAQSVPLEFQAGSYRHRVELETPDILRAYDRVLPDGRSFVVRIRR